MVLRIELRDQKGSEDEQYEGKMEEKRWVVIWSDDEELKKVISSSKSQIKN